MHLRQKSKSSLFIAAVLEVQDAKACSQVLGRLPAGERVTENMGMRNWFLGLKCVAKFLTVGESLRGKESKHGKVG